MTEPSSGSVAFESAKEECLESISGNITGEVPSWICGSLYRIGPGLFDIGQNTYNHYFDGLALLLKFEIRNGKVLYQHQFLKSDTFKTNWREQRIAVTEFGTVAFPDPCKSLFGRMAAYFESKEISDNTNINFISWGDQLYVTTESQFINRIDPATLDRIEKKDLTKCVPVNMATAHPHYDSEGNVWNFGLNFSGKRPLYSLFRLNKTNHDKGELIGSIQSRWTFNPAYHHSFAWTENYIVFMESPLTLDVLKIFRLKLMNKAFASAFNWNSGERTLLHVMRKSDGKVVQVFRTSHDCFVFHHGNAYEEKTSSGDTRIVFDVCSYDNGNFIQDISLQKMREGSVATAFADDKAYLVRFTLTLGSDNDVECQVFGDGLILELPQYNYSYNGHKSRYLYGITHQSGHDVYSLCKVDWDSGKVLYWSQEHCDPSECLFVARPSASREDDGVLLSVVTRVKRPRSLFLLILDATKFEVFGTVDFDGVSVPKSLHGAFLSGNF